MRPRERVFLDFFVCLIALLLRPPEGARQVPLHSEPKLLKFLTLLELAVPKRVNPAGRGGRFSLGVPPVS